MRAHDNQPKRAYILSPAQESVVLRHLTTTRYPQRDRVLFLLSLKAGLGAQDISALTWSMVTDPNGQVRETLLLKHRGASRTDRRQIPLHPLLREAIVDLHEERASSLTPDLPVIYSERGRGLSAGGIKLWFRRLYRTLGMDGYSSMSGRRTFITRAAQKVVEVGGSLRDVQQLAGHANMADLQRYVEEEPAAQQKLIRLL